ncbi:hypothetical protein [Streptomyces sp. NPDC058527]|uniref:hypothetical protein n=1 Tax=unclassified Streptomyces TaxID=2593676 RepID=UPI003665FDBB
MVFTEWVACHLDEFRPEVVDRLRQEIDERVACLRNHVFVEAKDGSWASAVVHLLRRSGRVCGADRSCRRRGQDKDAWIAVTTFAHALVEELDDRPVLGLSRARGFPALLQTGR